MSGQMYEGWEGSVLYSIESTPGMLVTPATGFGIVKSCTARRDGNVEEEFGIGDYRPVSLEEGIIETGGSMEFLPMTIAPLSMITRDGSGKLPSHSIHVAAGAGINHIGSKFNQTRISLDAGGRLRMSADWFSLGAPDAAQIAQVTPSGAGVEVVAWYEVVTNLPDIVSSFDITIAQNLTRKPVIRNSSTVMPVVGQNRGAYMIKEGHQRITASAKFYERPAYNVLADLIASISTFTATVTGNVGDTPLNYVITLSNGKPRVNEIALSENSDANFPVEMHYQSFAAA